MEVPVEHNRKKVEALHKLCCDERTHSAVRFQNLEDTSLEYLDLFITTALSSPSTTPKVEALISAMGIYANPKEMLLAIGEQVEKAEAEVDECYGDEIEEEDYDEEYGMEQVEEKGKAWEEQKAARKKVDWVGERLRLGILSYAAVFPRIKSKNPGSILTDIITSIHDTLSSLSSALMSGQIMSSSTTRALLRAICAMTTAGNTWIETQEGDKPEMRMVLLSVMCKFLVMFEPMLGCGVLERWYVGHYKETLPPRRYEGEQPMEAEWVMNREVMTLAYNTLLSTGYTPTTLLPLLTTPPPPTNPFLPLSLLLLTATNLVPPTTTSPSPLDHLLLDPKETLSGLMPILGGALNGSAVDAAMGWVGEMVWRVEREGAGVGYEEATMLIEVRSSSKSLLSNHVEVELKRQREQLIMPNMVKEESELARFASHKILGRIIGNCEKGVDKVLLFDQLLSEENPFEQVRISAMALLKDELASALSHPPGPASIFCPELQDILLPKLFSLPECDPSVLEMDLEHLLEPGAIWCEWMVGGLGLFYFLLSRAGDRVDLRAQLVLKKNLWWGPIKNKLPAWESEAQALMDTTSDGHEGLDSNLRVFALREAVERVERVV